MNTNQASGNDPQMTIDHNGKVVPKGYGISRWSAPKRYDCQHSSEQCDNPAVKHISDFYNPHNCCGTHEEGAVQ